MEVLWPVRRSARTARAQRRVHVCWLTPRYVTTPLRALFDTQKIHKGGFYHDGRFATLDAVVTHYDNHLKLKLSAAQRRDPIEYLTSI
jgi:hypothetical protein